MVSATLLVVAAVAALAGSSEAAFGYGQSSFYFFNFATQLNAQLKSAGMMPNYSFDQVYSILKQIDSQPGVQLKPKNYDRTFAPNYLVHMGKVYKGEENISCEQIYYTYIGEFKDAIDSLPRAFSPALRRYIETAFNSVAETCTERFSANNWQPMEDKLDDYYKPKADIVEKVFGGTNLNDVEKFDAKSYETLAERITAAAKESGKSSEEVLQDMKDVPDRLRHEFKNIGNQKDRFNARVGAIYASGHIIDFILEDSRLINNLVERYMLDSKGVRDMVSAANSLDVATTIKSYAKKHALDPKSWMSHVYWMCKLDKIFQKDESKEMRPYGLFSSNLYVEAKVIADDSVNIGKFCASFYAEGLHRQYNS